MRQLRPLAFAVVLSVTATSTAHADWFVTPYIGLKFAGDTSIVNLDQGASNTRVTLGATGGFVSDGILGVEADFGYAPRFFERSSGVLVARSHVLTVMSNVILTAPRSLTGYSLRPFVSGGGGLMRIGIDDVLNIFPVDSNLFGVNIGGGATGGLTNRTSIRFDLRYFKSVSTDPEETATFGPTTLSFWRAAIGLTIR